MYSVRCWKGVCHRYTETLTSTAAHTHTGYTVGVRPPGFEVLCIREPGYTSSTCGLAGFYSRCSPTFTKPK